MKGTHISCPTPTRSSRSEDIGNFCGKGGRGHTGGIGGVEEHIPEVVL